MQNLVGHGLNMPKLGLGTWPMKGDECRRAVESAIAIGYRHIDTAEMYDNEEAVGAALRASGQRAEIHVTSKVWPDHLAPDALKRAFDATLRKLGSDYVDLYLIHWPDPKMDLPAALRVMGEFQAQGRARAIGVSNFPVALMRQAVEQIGAPIACNQVEYHVLLSQAKVLDYARAHGMAVTAYAPLSKGSRLGELPVMQAIARKHGATANQIALAWLLGQDGVAAIPKSSRPENQRENFEAQKIVLDAADNAAIAGLKNSQRFVDFSRGIPWD